MKGMLYLLSLLSSNYFYESKGSYILLSGLVYLNISHFEDLIRIMHSRC